MPLLMFNRCVVQCGKLFGSILLCPRLEDLKRLGSHAAEGAQLTQVIYSSDDNSHDDGDDDGCGDDDDNNNSNNNDGNDDDDDSDDDHGNVGVRMRNRVGVMCAHPYLI